MAVYENSSDEELVSLVRSGNKEVIDYLLEKYKDVVLKKARAMFLIGGETDDLIQEGMTGLYKAIRDYDPKQSASFATFARLCIDRQLYTVINSSHRKKHQPLNSYVSFNDQAETELSELQAVDPEFIILEEESFLDLKTKIYQSLSPLETQVLDYYLDGKSYLDIANTLGRNPKSIDNAMQRIREKTRKCQESFQKDGTASD